MGTTRLKAVIGLVVLVGVIVTVGIVRSGLDVQDPARLSDETLGAIADVTQAVVSGSPVPDELGLLDEADGPVYVVLRDGGSEVSSAWGSGSSAAEALVDGVGRAAATATEEPTAVELAFTHSYRPVAVDGTSPELTNLHRGVRGIELSWEGTTERYSPTWMLATNRDFDRVIELFANNHGLPDGRQTDGLEGYVFDAIQVLVLLDGDEPTAIEMFRGSQVVPIETVTSESVTAVADSLGDWLARAVHDDGRMTYAWWPSAGHESTANNMIRQWMATTALGRYAGWRVDDSIWDLTRRNIAYNLDHFYDVEDDLGLIIENGVNVKLGAVALAARAMVEHPDRAEYADEIAALLRMVDHLWREDGSFKTWYLPDENTGQENFYPGEALYLWSALIADGTAPDDLLDRFMQSFEYYRAWHLDPTNRNPAFVPWHTQAYWEVWQVTGDQDLADFVFEMNDWLLGVQEWDGAVYPDTPGRFYDPTRPFGPPHASSTGVYLEGLIDAYQLAVALGEDVRAEAYRVAIVRGLRSVMQQQFTDDVDMFYVSQRDRVAGGMRTNVYDNAIRVDNVQHNLMAVLKILDVFEDDDFTVIHR